MVMVMVTVTVVVMALGFLDRRGVGGVGGGVVAMEKGGIFPVEVQGVM